MDLKTQILDERLRLYTKLEGGYSFPLAGAIWWGAAAAMGYFVDSIEQWSLYAFIGSGMIFPLALLLSNLLRVNFMKEKSSVDSVLGPAFVGMLLSGRQLSPPSTPRQTFARSSSRSAWLCIGR